jgi:hypothetical protein
VVRNFSRSGVLITVINHRSTTTGDQDEETTMTQGFDTDGDGVADTLALDTTGDGVADAFARDTNGDNVIDTYQFDRNQDGLIDGEAVDMDGDGHFETVGADNDQNGLFETIVVNGTTYVDTDGEGTADTAVAPGGTSTTGSGTGPGSPLWNAAFDESGNIRDQNAYDLMQKIQDSDNEQIDVWLAPTPDADRDSWSDAVDREPYDSSEY